MRFLGNPGPLARTSFEDKDATRMSETKRSQTKRLPPDTSRLKPA